MGGFNVHILQKTFVWQYPFSDKIEHKSNCNHLTTNLYLWYKPYKLTNNTWTHSTQCNQTNKQHIYPHNFRRYISSVVSSSLEEEHLPEAKQIVQLKLCLIKAQWKLNLFSKLPGAIFNILFIYTVLSVSMYFTNYDLHNKQAHFFHYFLSC